MRRPRGAAPGGVRVMPERRGQGCLAQATSYWLTDFGLGEFWGCSPAYTVPALPSSLNADPGPDAAPPGVGPSSPHSWLGWPVPLGLPGPARAAPPTLSVSRSPLARATIARRRMGYLRGQD